MELSALTIRSQSVTDREGLQAICYRCSAANPLLGNPGDACTACGHAFVRSLMSFDILPLVSVASCLRSLTDMLNVARGCIGGIFHISGYLRRRSDSLNQHGAPCVGQHLQVQFSAESILWRSHGSDHR